MRTNGRPWVRSSSVNITVRARYDVFGRSPLDYSKLTHVQAHTKAKDFACIINEKADKRAKDHAHPPEETRLYWDADLSANELPFLLLLPNGRVCHDDMR